MEYNYKDYVPSKAETTRMVLLCKALAERANLLDKLHNIDRTIEEMDTGRDELDALLCNIRAARRG
mgnify:CR=1 FL=1|tara:strand:+ start:394 stop:591 length:198 start_codon:yes stop_codon:yes gene_type:complete